MDEEATPTLAPVPDVDLDEYKSTLIERFSNPGVRDTVAALCAESSDRIPKWLLPVVRRNLETGGEIRRSAAVVASWARYAEGTDEQGEPIEVVDRLRDNLMERRAAPARGAGRVHRQPRGVRRPGRRRALRRRLPQRLRSLHERGAAATLEALVSAPHGER